MRNRRTPDWVGNEAEGLSTIGPACHEGQGAHNSGTTALPFPEQLHHGIRSCCTPAELPIEQGQAGQFTSTARAGRGDGPPARRALQAAGPPARPAALSAHRSRLKSASPGTTPCTAACGAGQGARRRSRDGPRRSRSRRRAGVDAGAARPPISRRPRPAPGRSRVRPAAIRRRCGLRRRSSAAGAAAAASAAPRHGPAARRHWQRAAASAPC